MNQPWTSWLLAGALGASLAWNLHGRGTHPPEPVQTCSALELDELELSDEQRRELERWLASSCAESCSAEGDATARLRELCAALRDPEIAPEELRSLAAEVGRLRAAALAACVESILGVREVL